MSTTLPGGTRVAGFSTIFWKIQGWAERRAIFSRTGGSGPAAGRGEATTTVPSSESQRVARGSSLNPGRASRPGRSPGEGLPLLAVQLLHHPPQVRVLD